ncbi:MAG TPA: pyridoxal phosphate-dependent aminotransferase [Bacteroidales bacterium]|jgi:aspartate/methionine/tyrosine aminotransferase|nr:pyridoxal phosphate-dependent aminotransferase [Bacteroidales bacterium]
MKNTPIDFNVVDKYLNETRIGDLGIASIREIKRLIDLIEKESGQRYVRMEMGIPGLPPVKIGIEAEKEALDMGIPAIYPDIYGRAELKKEISRFVKLFLNLDVHVDGCIPTVGSMQGSFATFMTLNRMHKDKGQTLLINPGFPVHMQQLRILGIETLSFDVYDYRGDKLRDKLESYLSSGKVSTILYSNPNNPSWICFTDKELRIIAEMADKYNVIIIEDLAYFGMDFRHDYSQPGKPPYQPSVAHYTDNYVLLISSSKVFSYAGQRIGMMVISNKIFHTEAPDLLRFYKFSKVGHAMIFGTLYSLSSGTAHTPQFALTAILKAANDGRFNFVEDVKEYGEKARIMKKMFTDNGFRIVYDKDEDKPIADGFYFTFSYPGMTGGEMLHELLYYGISAIALSITGSERTEGVRACVSLVRRDQFPDLEKRLKQFHEDHL